MGSSKEEKNMGKEIINVLTDNLLDIVIAVISILVSYYVIPAIKNNLIPFLKEKRLLNIIKGFVNGVEKMAESGIIDKSNKKDKVVELLEEKGITVTPEVDALIEAAVKELDIIASTVVDEVKKAE